VIDGSSGSENRASHLIARAQALVTDDLICRTADAVLREPTPSGLEGAAAQRLAAWGSDVTPELSWQVQDVAPGRGNLFAWTGSEPWGRTAGVWFYTHLDHSLSGDPALDLGLTGWTSSPSAPVIDGHRVRALGLAVSRGPAICALVAVRALAVALSERGESMAIGVLLAAGGTHRHPNGALADVGKPARGLEVGLGIGVRAALATSWRPDAVVNVKGGAAGVLSAEPGYVMLEVSWREPFMALPARGSGPGAAVMAGVLASAVEAWREAYRAVSDGGQIAGDLCVGSVHSGLAYKTDLQPGYAVVGVYLSTVEGQEGSEIAARLEAHLRAELDRAGVATSHGTLAVTPYASHPAAATSEEAAVVLAARRAWERCSAPESSVVHGYRGSTDGVIFRRAGVPTVRFGPTPKPAADDPTVEEISLAVLSDFITMYIDTAATTCAALATIQEANSP
jgi:acetylornithine deacetylase/succinyl-diaminopimelate desuccinylase-like protein